MSEPQKLKVFLCHSSGDKATVRDLYKRLRTDDIDPWLDEKNLLPGQTWQQEIPKAIRAADAIVVCLSQSSITKEGYVQKEISYALDASEEKPEGTIFVIPLRLEDCKIPDRLKNWHVGNLYKEGGYEQLIRALQTRASELGLGRLHSENVASSLPPPPKPTIPTSSASLPPDNIAPRRSRGILAALYGMVQWVFSGIGSDLGKWLIASLFVSLAAFVPGVRDHLPTNLFPKQADTSSPKSPEAQVPSIPPQPVALPTPGPEAEPKPQPETPS